MMLIMGISCKEKAKSAEPTPPPEIEKMVQSLSPAYKEIVRFMELEVSDSTDMNTILNFMVLMENDEIQASDADQNLKLYKGIMKNGKAASLPIFEAKDSDLSLLVFTGKGYLGPVWARVLIDKNTGKTVKVSFGHQMESEGYGNGIVSSAFGDQFSEKQFSSGDNAFGLMQNGKSVIQGTSMVDGVSGATITSSAAVQMLNDGLKKYSSNLVAN